MPEPVPTPLIPPDNPPDSTSAASPPSESPSEPSGAEPVTVKRPLKHRTRTHVLSQQDIEFCLALTRGNTSREQAFINAYGARQTREATAMAAMRRVRSRYIREFLRKLQTTAAKAAELHAALIVRQLMCIAFFDIRQTFDEKGQLKLPHEMSEAVAAGISGMKNAQEFEPVTRTDPATGQQVTTNELRSCASEVKRVPPVEALKILAQIQRLIGPDAEPPKQPTTGPDSDNEYRAEGEADPAVLLGGLDGTSSQSSVTSSGE